MSKPSHLPHDLELEQCILGGILLAPEVLTALGNLEVDDFYDPRNRAVFGAMRNLEAACKPIDFELIAADVDAGAAQGKFDAIGGYAYLGEIASRVPTAENVEHYAAIVKRHSVSRRAILTLADLVEQARTGQLEGEDIVQAAVDRLGRIESGEAELGKPMGMLIREEFRQIGLDCESRANGQMVHVGVPTGLAELDKHIGGLPLGLMTILAGRPGMGKTTVAQAFLRAAANLTPDTPILYSYEDAEQGFAQRELASGSGIATQSIRAREFTRAEMSHVHVAAGRLLKRREVIVMAHGKPVDWLVRDVKRRRMKARAEGQSVCGLVIVDYLQNMPEAGGEGAAWRLGEICQRLVELAANERIAVVACSQLNRGIESRDDKRPRMSDLRESGKLEEKAKVILGLYKPSKYEEGVDPSRLDILVLKNHQGAAGDVCAEVYWDLRTHTICNGPSDLKGRM